MDAVTKLRTSSLFSVGQVTELAGVTIRTLRFYDKKELLRPSILSEAGYRMYTMKDIRRLQHILSLKMLGFSLEDIADVLREQADMRALVRLQRVALEEKITNLQRVLSLLTTLDTRLQARFTKPSGNTYHDDESETLDVETLYHLLEVIKMENSPQTKQWVQGFYTDEQRATIDAMHVGYTPEQAETDAKRWQDLLTECNAALDKDPASPEVQALADRWMSLVGEFTKGDQGIQGSLNTMYGEADKS